MIGNIYICLNEETYNSELPDLFSRYRRAEFDEEGALVQILPTTYAEMGEDNKRQYGRVLTFTKDDQNFYILEFTASWLSGEVSYLLDLGQGLEYPNNAVLTSDEAVQLVQENTKE